MFVAGNDAEAKATVADLLRSFGWRSILDLGGIEAARGMEMYLPLWVLLRSAQGTIDVQHQDRPRLTPGSRVAVELGSGLRRHRRRRRAQRAGRGGLPGPGRAPGAGAASGGDVVGGAAVSERPFGPDFTVTSLSYVVSLLPPDMVRDLRLAEHGYHVYPQGPYFAPRRDGRTCACPTTRRAGAAEIAKFAPGRRRRLRAAGTRWLAGLGRDGRAAADTRPAQAGLASARPTCSGQAGAADDAAQGGRTGGVRPDPAVHREHRRPGRGALRLRRDARACSASPA